ncbi:hypothetical protein [Mesorhizobium sp. CAU 1732]|uniref:hypothetical protein n=1 Tax=Mesorhizobium sp. CAU 1732 TaxID=3140358 RepID=UPI0032603F9F
MGDEGKRSGKERRPVNDNRNADGSDPNAQRKVDDVACQFATHRRPHGARGFCQADRRRQ